MRPHRIQPWLLALALAGPPALAGDPPAAAARVHDHEAYVFRVPDGTRSPGQRAAEASQNLNAVIDDNLPGAVSVEVQGAAASVRVGPRQMFRLVAADAAADGAVDLADDAPRVQARLDSFLIKERRRAQLQRGVLSLSLVVFFGLLTYLLIRLVRRSTLSWQEGLVQGVAAPGTPLARFGLASERNRSVLLLLLAAARLLAYAGAIYVFLLVSLSLFERTEPWRNQLVSWLTTPVLAVGERLLRGLPNVLLLGVLFAVVRGGWQALSVTFDRVAVGEAKVPGLGRQTVVPFRLLARAALVVAALLVIPLVTGYEGDLFTRVGLVLLAGVALSLVPLVATVAVGTYLLLREEYRLGEWVSVRMPGGKEIAGEVTSVDFLHLRLVPADGGEVRVPHLTSLWLPVEHLASTRGLSVELTWELAGLQPARATEALRQAADAVLAAHGQAPGAEVSLVEVTGVHARFQVTARGAPERLRSPLLAALSTALRVPGAPA